MIPQTKFLNGVEQVPQTTCLINVIKSNEFGWVRRADKIRYNGKQIYVHRLHEWVACDSFN